MAAKEEATSKAEKDNCDKTEINTAHMNDEENLDKIEVANEGCDETQDDGITITKTDTEGSIKNKGAGQFAKEFFKILHETINVKYPKTEDQKIENEEDVKETNDVEDNTENNDDLLETTEERKMFDRKISSIVEYFYSMVKNPKMEGPERVRRKSSCFWAEQSPTDKGSRQDTIDQCSPEEIKTEDKDGGDEKMETLKEFLTSSCHIPTDSTQALNKSPRKSLEIIKNTNAKIQRKIFSKRSTSSEERQSIFDLLFDTKERRSSSITKLLNKKQKSLDETTMYGIKKSNDAPSCSMERKDSIVDYLFKKDKSVSFSALLRRFSQDSAEISFIDESPEMKTRESLVDIVMKYMDSFDSYVSKDNRRDSGSKTNLFKSTNVSIAKPDDFQITPEGESTSRVLTFEIIKKGEIRPTLKDMGTSCDISESLTQDSLESESPDDVILKEVREGYWIKSDQLEELRKCAEIIFKEVQHGQNEKQKESEAVIVAEKENKPTVNIIEELIETDPSIDQEELAKSICEQCMIEALLGETKILPGTLETNFEYDPSVPEDVIIVQSERLGIPFFGRELEMINESFETEDSPQ